MDKSRIYNITSSYSRTHRNFAILNLPAVQEDENDSELQRAAKICFNILCRGQTVNPSSFLRKEFWGKDEIIRAESMHDAFPFISSNEPHWDLDYLKTSEAAQTFICKILPESLGDWRWVTSFIRPEVSFEDIFNEHQEDFVDQQVDFFIPYINVVIEIDGGQHEEEKANDARRDRHLKNKKANPKVTVHRIKTSDIHDQTDHLQSVLQKIKGLCERNPTYSIYSGFKKRIDDAEADPDWLKEYLVPTYVNRLQHVLLQLLVRGCFTSDQGFWHAKVLCDDVFMGLPLSDHHDEIIRLAADDLSSLLQDVMTLLSDEGHSKRLQFDLVASDQIGEGPETDVTIDLSLNRWDSSDLKEDHVVICRSSEFDSYVSRHKEIQKRDYYQSFPVAELKFQFNKEIEEDPKEAALTKLLGDVFGYEKYRDGQLEIIENVLMGQDTIGILPTGAGKSICYQLPGIMKGGTSIIICPINALMLDQKYDLERIGITRSQVINVDTPREQRDKIFEELRRGQIRFLFMSPERLQLPETRRDIR